MGSVIAVIVSSSAITLHQQKFSGTLFFVYGVKHVPAQDRIRLHIIIMMVYWLFKELFRAVKLGYSYSIQWMVTIGVLPVGILSTLYNLEYGKMLQYQCHHYIWNGAK